MTQETGLILLIQIATPKRLSDQDKQKITLMHQFVSIFCISLSRKAAWNNSKIGCLECRKKSKVGMDRRMGGINIKRDPGH